MRWLIFALFLFCIVNFHTATAGDYYVATTGSNTTGNGSQTHPWKTITYALSQIDGAAGNPHIIHVAPGTYSPSLTGETYPLIMKSYISLCGSGMNSTILDAEANYDFTHRHINLNQISFCEVSNVTLKNGFISNVHTEEDGGSIYIINSSFITIQNNNIIQNKVIKNVLNNARGGAISCRYVNHISIVNNLISSNLAKTYHPVYYKFTARKNKLGFAEGGGIYINGDNNYIAYNTITSNYSDAIDTYADGGGICCYGNNIIIGNIISGNSASNDGGGLVISGSLVCRNIISNNGGYEVLSGGGIATSLSSIIGASINNGNNIFNNHAYLGYQLSLYQWTTEQCLANYNYFGDTIDPHNQQQIYGNFLLDPYMSVPIVFDTSGLIVIPSPVKFDTVYTDSVKTINSTFFNVVNSLYDSIVVTNVSFTNSAFSISNTAFTINAAERITFGIVFHPDSTGIYTDTMTIVTNRGNFKIAVSGTALPLLALDDLTNVKTFHLSQNYPNPFNPNTTISYQLPVNAKVSVKIYNTLGQEVNTLVNSHQSYGKHEVMWNGRDSRGSTVSSGLYLYRIEAVSEKGRFTETKKMIFLK